VNAKHFTMGRIAGVKCCKRIRKRNTIGLYKEKERIIVLLGESVVV